MIQENEIIVPALALGGHILYLFPFVRNRIRRIAHSKLLIASFYCLFSGWILSVVESVYLPVIFNFIEHLCYCISALLLMGWARLLQPKKRPHS